MSFAKLFENLFISSYFFAINKELLKNHRISHILCCAEELNPFFPLDFKYLCISISTDKGISNFTNFRKSGEFIQEGRKLWGVLVHCMNGISRSPTIFMAYMIEYLNYTTSKAYEFVKDKRPIISNLKYRNILEEYENFVINERKNKII